jgi:hypothetical protein
LTEYLISRERGEIGKEMTVPRIIIRNIIFDFQTVEIDREWVNWEIPKGTGRAGD